MAVYLRYEIETRLYDLYDDNDEYIQSFNSFGDARDFVSDQRWEWAE